MEYLIEGIIGVIFIMKSSVGDMSEMGHRLRRGESLMLLIFECWDSGYDSILGQTCSKHNL